MANPPKISVVTPTFNGIATLRERIESVLAQSYQKWEHIVVDGDSTDGTLELIRGYPHLQWASEKDKASQHADMLNFLERLQDRYSIATIVSAPDLLRQSPADYDDLSHVNKETQQRLTSALANVLPHYLEAQQSGDLHH